MANPYEEGDLVHFCWDFRGGRGTNRRWDTAERNKVVFRVVGVRHGYVSARYHSGDIEKFSPADWSSCEIDHRWFVPAGRRPLGDREKIKLLLLE